MAPRKPYIPITDADGKHVANVIWTGTWKKGMWTFNLLRTLDKDEAADVKRRFDSAVDRRSSLGDTVYYDSYGEQVFAFEGIVGTVEALRSLLVGWNLRVDYESIVWPDEPGDPDAVDDVTSEYGASEEQMLYDAETARLQQILEEEKDRWGGV